MARPGKTGARERLNLDVSAAVRGRILALRDLTGADSISEVVRRAVELYERLVHETCSGSKVVIQHGPGEGQTLVLVPEAPVAAVRAVVEAVKETPPPASGEAEEAVRVIESSALEKHDTKRAVFEKARQMGRNVTAEDLRAILASKKKVLENTVPGDCRVWRNGVEVDSLEDEESDTEYGPVEDI